MREIEIHTAFQHSVRHTTKDGRHQYECKRGLWAVDAPDEVQAHNEALHYFRQYYADGEYSEAQHPELMEGAE